MRCLSKSTQETKYNQKPVTHLLGLRPKNSLGTFAICRVENLLCEVRLPTLAEMRERDTAKTAIKILTNTEHPKRHLCTSRIYDHYATKPNMPKPMFIRAMEYLGRFGIDPRKIEPTSIFMRPPWKEMDGDRDDLILTGIPMDHEVKGSGRRLRKYYKKNTKYM
jgi:hypothetical protein